MALVPNTTYKLNGVTVNEKIIPDGTRWKDGKKASSAGFSANALYKGQRKLCGTGKPKFVTIHNTEDLKNIDDDGMQYTLATYNENMGSTRVHFYVDDLGAWQNLKAGTGMCGNDPVNSAEISWHSGDGTNPTGGNETSLSMEVIMNDTPEHDKKAYDNAARIAAWLLWKHGLTIDKLVTHTYWVNKSAGKTFSDPDEQCTSSVPGKRWCPAYIFGSTNHTVALANWKAFKATVKKYLDALTSASLSGTGTSSGAGTDKAKYKLVSCHKIYRSIGIARKRTAPEDGAEVGRCSRECYYTAAATTTVNGRKWFKHKDGTFSAITDTDGRLLFEEVGTYTEKKALAPVKHRTGAGTSYEPYCTIPAGETVYQVGTKTEVNGIITWIKVVYDGKMGWCDKQWVK